MNNLKTNLSVDSVYQNGPIVPNYEFWDFIVSRLGESEPFADTRTDAHIRKFLKSISDKESITNTYRCGYNTLEQKRCIETIMLTINLLIPGSVTYVILENECMITALMNQVDMLYSQVIKILGFEPLWLNERDVPVNIYGVASDKEVSTDRLGRAPSTIIFDEEIDCRVYNLKLGLTDIVVFQKRDRFLRLRHDEYNNLWWSHNNLLEELVDPVYNTTCIDFRPLNLIFPAEPHVRRETAKVPIIRNNIFSVRKLYSNHKKKVRRKTK